jgi:hypothetical protein
MFSAAAMSWMVSTRPVSISLRHRKARARPLAMDITSGVGGHGLQPPTWATRVNRKRVAGVKVVTDEPDHGAAHYA